MLSDSFIADFHIHSKYSRATARNLDLEHIHIWAQLKGIAVVGTGDFTHPEWFKQICEKLQPAEPGLYRLKPDIARHCDESVPLACRAPVRFMLSCEISNIYKKDGRTRKNHNLVFFPDLDKVSHFNTRLQVIGNINADGRPILGLDARDLLEIVLETAEDGFLVPAHIWTPWFSMLGSKSGFDSIEACFEDLSSHIFAAETGLSSDPAMNWRVTGLDTITLISNSDAHSPSKIGREANLFNTSMDYFVMRRAMQSGDRDQFVGTFEFFPEEGKYHADGHRKCEVCLMPAETKSHFGKCPVCKRPLTLGVLHRVEELATRPDGGRPEKTVPFYRLIPLDDLLAEILKVGPQSKKVRQTYHTLLAGLGSEFKILHYMDRPTLESAGIPLLAEAISRMRDNRVSFSPGFDGRFGTLKIFGEQERDQLLGQQSLFPTFEKSFRSKINKTRYSNVKDKEKSVPTFSSESVDLTKSVAELNDDQKTALDQQSGPLMIVAGPGTGKTRTVTHKIARQIESGADIQRLLAVTFTNKAAEEMRERLRSFLGNGQQLPFVGTFHGLGYRLLSESINDFSLSIVDEASRKALVRDTLTLNGLTQKGCGVSVDDLMGWLVNAKQQMLSSEDSLATVCPPDRLNTLSRCYASYERLLRLHQAVDFDDLIFKAVQLLETDIEKRKRYWGRFTDIFIDEYQDINASQYRLMRLLAGNWAKICVIGDPDQAIYGFRGSDDQCFKWFMNDFPKAKTIFLTRNYRSIQTILDVSAQVINHNPAPGISGGRKGVYSALSGDKTIQLIERATENAEAVAIGKIIETMVGGTGFFSLDSGAVDSGLDQKPFSFADVAVLFRTRNQGHSILQMLEKAGIPCQVVDRQNILDHSAINAVLAIFKLLNEMGIYNDLQVAMKLLKSSISIKTLDSFKSWAYANHLLTTNALVQACRHPIPAMGKKSQQRLFQLISRLLEAKEKIRGLSVGRSLEWILDYTNTRKTLNTDHLFEQGWHHLMAAANHHSNDPAGFLAAVALSKDTDVYDPRVEKVSLLTMHAAKGLEFPVVFIAGCEEGLIPYRSATQTANLEEERRLFYVALTRAKRHLFLTKSGTRRINGQKVLRHWSPFIADIENRYKRMSEPGRNVPKIPVQEQLPLF